MDIFLMENIMFTFHYKHDYYVPNGKYKCTIHYEHYTAVYRLQKYRYNTYYIEVLLFLSTGGELLHISREEGVVLFSPITNTSNVIITPSTMVTHIQTCYIMYTILYITLYYRRHIMLVL